MAANLISISPFAQYAGSWHFNCLNIIFSTPSTFLRAQITDCAMSITPQLLHVDPLRIIWLPDVFIRSKKWKIMKIWWNKISSKIDQKNYLHQVFLQLINQKQVLLFQLQPLLSLVNTRICSNLIHKLVHFLAFWSVCVTFIRLFTLFQLHFLLRYFFILIDLLWVQRGIGCWLHLHLARDVLMILRNVPRLQVIHIVFVKEVLDLCQFVGVWYKSILTMDVHIH